MSESSDEAPEEVTFQESKLSTRLRERRQKETEDAQRRDARKLRRERDYRLRDQQASGRKQRKLLSELLQEDDEEEEAAEPIEPVAKPLPRAKKLSIVKDGVTVRVLEPAGVSKKGKKRVQLPPAGRSAVRMRDQFFFRDTVRRK